MSLADLMPGMSMNAMNETSDTILFDLWEIGEGTSFYGSMVSLNG